MEAIVAASIIGASGAVGGALIGALASRSTIKKKAKEEHERLSRDLHASVQQRMADQRDKISELTARVRGLEQQHLECVQAHERCERKMLMQQTEIGRLRALYGNKHPT